MRIYIRNLSAITVRDDRRVRFSVTYAEDDGTPVSTELGWTVDTERHIRVPANRTFQGRYYPIVEPSDDLLRRLGEGLEKIKFVHDTLGPQVEQIDTNGNEHSDEEAEV